MTRSRHAIEWARMPLGNNRVILETEEEEAIQGDLRLMGARTDWGSRCFMNGSTGRFTFPIIVRGVTDMFTLQKFQKTQTA